MKTKKFLNLILISCLVGFGFYWMSYQNNQIPTKTYSNFLNDVQKESISSIKYNSYTHKAIVAENLSTNLEQEASNQLEYTVQLPDNSTDILNQLSKQGTTVSIDSEHFNFFGMLMSWLPTIFLIAFLVWLFKQQGSGIQKALGGNNKKNVAINPDENKTRFNDVAGCEEAKQEVQEIVDFLKNPNFYERVGGKVPKGILMEGPPGTGKTLLAKAIAGEAGVPFFSYSGSDFVEMFVGMGARRIREMLDTAKKNAPCLVFIDEIDSLGRARGQGMSNGGQDEREQTLNQLLVAMGGFEENKGIIFIGATNRVDLLDPALRRPGRFDRHVSLGLPDRQGRAEILAVHAKNIPVAHDINWDEIAAGTPGFSGAELANLLNEAALMAAKNQELTVSKACVEKAKDKIIMGVERARGIPLERERRTTAYHEAGHTLVAMYLPQSEPLHKVSIVPRGRALGVTVQLPKEDVMGYEKEALMTRLAIMMGGRAAEEVALRTISTGASNDFEKANQLAREMVVRLGMSELGPISFEEEEFGRPSKWSEEWKLKADNVIHQMLVEQYQCAIDLLKEHREELEKLSQALLQHETLDAEQIKAACKGQLT